MVVLLTPIGLMVVGIPGVSKLKYQKQVARRILRLVHVLCFAAPCTPETSSTRKPLHQKPFTPEAS